MTIEAAQNISELNTSYPRATDLLKEGDDHIRLIKANLKRTFPSINSTVRMSSDTLNNLDNIMTASPGGLTFNQNITQTGGTFTTQNIALEKSGALRLKSAGNDKELNLSMPNTDSSKVIVNRSPGVTTWDWNGTNLANVSNTSITGNIDWRGRGNQLYFNNGYQDGTNRNTPLYHANNGANNNNQRWEGLCVDNGHDMVHHTIITNNNNQAYMSFTDKGRLDVNGPSAGDKNNMGVFTGGRVEAGLGMSVGGARIGPDGNIYGTVFSGFGSSSQYLNQALSYVRDYGYRDTWLGGRESGHIGQTHGAVEPNSGKVLTAITQSNSNYPNTGGICWIEDVIFRALWKNINGVNQVVGQS